MIATSTGKGMPQTVVAHLGARLHYAAAEALNNRGMLAKLFTDLYLDRNSTRFALLNKISRAASFSLLKKNLSRSSHLNKSRVTTFPLLGLQYWLELALNPANTDIFLKYNRKFGNKVAGMLPKVTFDAIYGFSGSSLEVFEASRRLNTTRFLEQMSAPVSVSQEVIQAEMQQWPGWQEQVTSLWDLDKWHERESCEWQMADCIIAPSRYIAQQLTRYNIPSQKIVQIPYAVPLAQYPARQRNYKGKEKLKAVYVGDLRLLKGIPYLLKAITKIGSDKVDLACIGHSYLSDSALAPYRNKIRFTGRLPRDEVLQWYEWADLVVMPSLCEGSSTVTYEAKASGLPVIATFSSGAWLEDGVDGISIPARSSDAIAEALQQFLSNPSLINQMSTSAIQKRHEFGWEAYQNNLGNLIASGIR